MPENRIFPVEKCGHMRAIDRNLLFYLLFICKNMYVCMYVCMHELCVYVRRIFHSVKREKKTTATVCGVWCMGY